MTIENIINNLAAKGAKPALPKPAFTLIFCVIFLIFYLAILLQIFGLRDDFGLVIRNHNFQLELAANIALIISSITAVIFLRLPKLNEKSWINLFVIFSFVLLLVGICINCCAAKEMHCASNVKCLIGIILFSLVPMLFLITILRRGVMTNYLSSFLLIGVASGSFSYMVERLANKTEEIHHLLLWHFAPIFLVILLSAFLIKKLVKKL